MCTIAFVCINNRNTSIESWLFPMTILTENEGIVHKYKIEKCEVVY